jgi:hypothetical protein
LGCFHLVIITIIAFNFNGCGYKKAPYYEEKVDNNVTLIIQEQQKSGAE